jgi:hypothetical protein
MGDFNCDSSYCNSSHINLLFSSNKEDLCSIAVRRVTMASAVEQIKNGLFWGIGFFLGFILVIIILSLLLLPATHA